MVNTTSNPLRLIIATMFALQAVCAMADAKDDADARYRSERALCADIQDGERRANCLREAAAAREAALRGQLDDAQGSYERNAMARCEALPAEERDSCRRRVRGEGETRGSVGSGGVIREYREFTLPPVLPKEQ